MLLELGDGIKCVIIKGIQQGRRLEGYSLDVLLGLGVVRFKKMKCNRELMQCDGRLVDVE